jgi:hypothetical protein
MVLVVVKFIPCSKFSTRKTLIGFQSGGDLFRCLKQRCMLNLTGSSRSIKKKDC